MTEGVHWQDKIQEWLGVKQNHNGFRKCMEGEAARAWKGRYGRCTETKKGEEGMVERITRMVSQLSLL